VFLTQFRQNLTDIHVPSGLAPVHRLCASVSASPVHTPDGSRSAGTRSCPASGRHRILFGAAVNGAGSIAKSEKMVPLERNKRISLEHIVIELGAEIFTAEDIKRARAWQNDVVHGDYRIVVALSIFPPVDRVALWI
jgi:hypothetical protein